MSTTANKLQFYNAGNSLGVIGTHPAHQGQSPRPKGRSLELQDKELG